MTRMKYVALVAAATFLLVACGDDDVATDSGAPDSTVGDAGDADSGALDSTVGDGGTSDAGDAATTQSVTLTFAAKVDAEGFS
ncbi:MAG: hypothetical protein DRJ42_26860, partial [Deltaproteobacteria bacterium]